MPEDAPSAVIALAAATAKRMTAEVTAVPRQGDGLVTVRPKPERRKNARERAKERAKETSAKGGTTPDTTAKAKSKAATRPKTKAKKSNMTSKAAR
jgi:hypothetical protein